MAVYMYINNDSLVTGLPPRCKRCVKEAIETVKSTVQEVDLFTLKHPNLPQGYNPDNLMSFMGKVCDSDQIWNESAFKIKCEAHHAMVFIQALEQLCPSKESDLKVTRAKIVELINLIDQFERFIIFV